MPILGLANRNLSLDWLHSLPPPPTSWKQRSQERTLVFKGWWNLKLEVDWSQNHHLGDCCY